MSESVVSRLTIALQASAAAALWAKDTGQPKPQPPYDELLEPAHFNQWRVDFDRQYALLTAPPESEGSA